MSLLMILSPLSRSFKQHSYLRFLVGKPEGKIPLARNRCRWNGNIKMDLEKLGVVVETGFNWLRTEPTGGGLQM
jgi:hypothetical protein